MGLKYEDYAKSVQSDESIEGEIKEAAKATEVRREIPESVRARFDGKSIDEVLEAYANAERKISEQGNTIGKLRQTSDQLIELQLLGPSKPAGSTNDDVEDPLTVDALYDNPQEAVSRVVTKQTKDLSRGVEEVTAYVRQVKTESELTKQFPNWQKDIQDPEFGQWVQGSRYRERLAAAGNNYDLDAAVDLLSMWDDHKKRSQDVEQRRKRDRQLDEATLESSSPTGLEPEESYSRSHIMKMKIAAKRGNREAEDWVRAHGAAINLAYAEGRITD